MDFFFFFLDFFPNIVNLYKNNNPLSNWHCPSLDFFQNFVGFLLAFSGFDIVSIHKYNNSQPPPSHTLLLIQPGIFLLHPSKTTCAFLKSSLSNPPSPTVMALLNHIFSDILCIVKQKGHYKGNPTGSLDIPKAGPL